MLPKKHRLRMVGTLLGVIMMSTTHLKNAPSHFFSCVSGGSITTSNTGIKKASPSSHIAAVKNSSSNTDRALHVSYHRIPDAKLEFVHIPKTGGTAIELAAAQANITWGKCHFSTPPQRYAPGGKFTPQSRTDFAGCFRPTVPKGMGLPSRAWHLPPAWLRDSGNALTTFSNKHYFSNTALFAVVRNPYTKLVSEYYCPWQGYHGKYMTPLTLNKFLQDKLRYAKKVKKYGTTHMIPQVEFIFNMNKLQKQQQVVDHVLFKENFAEEMNRLMIEYDMPPKITQLLSTVVNGGESQTERMTFKNLTRVTIQMINDLYKNDFDLLGYRMIPASLVAMDISSRSPAGWELDYDIRSAYMP